MFKVRSLFRFSSKVVKLDIDSILSNNACKGTSVYNNNMLLFYYPINKSHFETGQDCIETDCYECEETGKTIEHMMENDNSSSQIRIKFVK